MQEKNQNLYEVESELSLTCNYFFCTNYNALQITFPTRLFNFDNETILKKQYNIVTEKGSFNHIMEAVSFYHYMAEIITPYISQCFNKFLLLISAIDNYPY